MSEFCSPFKASSVKTKVEAFEAVLSSKGTTSTTSVCGDLESDAVLPEARVVLQRLTDRQLKEAGVKTPRAAAASVASPAPPSAATAAAAAVAAPSPVTDREVKPTAAEEKRGTFVLKEPSPNKQVCRYFIINSLINWLNLSFRIVFNSIGLVLSRFECSIDAVESRRLIHIVPM